MTPTHCTGTLKSGKHAGGPCGKFLGELTEPYRVCCSRCGTWNEGSPTKLFTVRVATREGRKIVDIYAVSEEDARRTVEAQWAGSWIQSVEEQKGDAQDGRSAKP